MEEEGQEKPVVGFEEKGEKGRQKKSKKSSGIKKRSSRRSKSSQDIHSLIQKDEGERKKLSSSSRKSEEKSVRVVVAEPDETTQESIDTPGKVADNHRKNKSKKKGSRTGSRKGSRKGLHASTSGKDEDDLDETGEDDEENKALRRSHTVQHLESPEPDSAEMRKLRKRSISGNFSSWFSKKEAQQSKKSGSHKSSSGNLSARKRKAGSSTSSGDISKKSNMKREGSKKSLRKLDNRQFFQEVHDSSLRRSTSTSSLSPRKIDKTPAAISPREEDLVFEALRRLREHDKRMKSMQKSLAATEERAHRAEEELKLVQEREKRLRRTLGLGKEEKSLPSGSRQQLKLRVLELENELQEVKAASDSRIEQMGHLLGEADKRAVSAGETARRALNNISQSEQKALDAELKVDQLMNQIEGVNVQNTQLASQLSQAEELIAQLKEANSTSEQKNDAHVIEVELELRATKLKVEQLSQVAVLAAKRAKQAESQLKNANRSNRIASLTLDLLQSMTAGGVVLPAGVLEVVNQLSNLLKKQNTATASPSTQKPSTAVADKPASSALHSSSPSSSSAEQKKKQKDLLSVETTDENTNQSRQRSASFHQAAVAEPPKLGHVRNVELRVTAATAAGQSTPKASKKSGKPTSFALPKGVKPLFEGEALRVILHEVRGIQWGQVNPYCECELRGQIQKTRLLSESVREARWDETVMFAMSNATAADSITLRLMSGDASASGKKKSQALVLGVHQVPLSLLDQDSTPASAAATTAAAPSPPEKKKQGLPSAKGNYKPSADGGIWCELSVSDEAAAGQFVGSGAAIRVDLQRCNAYGVPLSGTGIHSSAAVEKNQDSLQKTIPPTALESISLRMHRIDAPEENDDADDVIPVDESDFTPLERAANAYPIPNLSGVACLLEKRRSAGDAFDVEFLNDSEQSYLHLMALHGQDSLVSWLIEKGCAVETEDYNGCTALHMAAAKGHDTCVEALIAAGASVHAEDSLAKTTPLHYAASHGHTAALQVLLRRGAEVNHRDRNGCTALMKAAAAGETKSVKALLAEKADPTLLDRDEANAYLYAAMNGESKVALLLSKCKDGFRATPSLRGDSPLWAALLHDDLDRAGELLAKGGKSLLNAPHGPHRLTVLQRALLHAPLLKTRSAKKEVEANCLKVVKFLLERGAAVDVASAEGKSALFYAAHRGYGQAVSALLEDGAQVNLKDSAGNIPLHFARNAPVAELLLKASEDPKKDCVQANAEGCIPLHAAFAFGRSDVLSVLFSFANSQSMLNIKNKSGNTPLQCALAGSKKVILPFYAEDENMVHCGGLFIGRVDLSSLSS